MKKIYFLLFFLTIGVALFAQDASHFTGSLLWKVSGKDLKEPSYIMGTYHLFTESLVDEVTGLREAINVTKQVVGELDMQDMASAQMKMMQLSVLPAEESYKQLLSPGDYEKLDAGLKKIMGTGLDQLGALKPGMLLPMLTMILHKQVYPDYDPASFEGIDAYLQRMAREANKPVLGLETIDDQIHLMLDSQPQKWQMESLLCSIEHIEDAVEALKTMVDDYREGNLYKIYADQYHNENGYCLSFTLDFKEAMLGDRNNKWMEKLPAIMKDKSSLIVVGALHLAGEEGLLYQLNKKGYKVEAVK